jgi:hypothetical protein
MQTAQYTEMVRVRAPAGLPEALAQAAKARNMRVADYVRQSMLACLALDGIRLRDGRVEAAEARA